MYLTRKKWWCRSGLPGQEGRLVENRSTTGNSRLDEQLTSGEQSRDGESASKDESGLHIEGEENVQDGGREGESVPLSL